MKKVIVFLADGFEEAEALVPADILRRAGIDVTLMSVTGSFEVTGSHSIKVTADSLFDGKAIGDAVMLVLPGGPGASSYIRNKALTDALLRHSGKGGHIAAICAAPVTLGKLGLLDGAAATCYPSMAGELIAKTCKSGDAVVADGKIITGQAAGASMQFGLAIVSALAGEQAASQVKAAMHIG